MILTGSVRGDPLELVGDRGEPARGGGDVPPELADLAPQPDGEHGEDTEPGHAEPDEQQHPEQHAGQTRPPFR